MERQEAIHRLTDIVNQDLRPLIDTYNLKRTDFENSRLYSKLRQMIVAGRIWESKREERSILHSVTTFDLDNPEVYRQVKADYDLVRFPLLCSPLKVIQLVRLIVY